MKTLIYEPNSNGHRLHFVELIAEALLDLGHDVHIATAPSAPESDEWGIFIAPIEHSVEVSLVAPEVRGSLVRSGLPRLRGFRKALRMLHVDHAYIPDADGITQYALLLRPMARDARRGVQTEALILRARFAYPAPTPGLRARSAVSAFSCRHAPWSVVHYLDPLAVEAAPWIDPTDWRHRVIPEPVEQLAPVEPTVARRQLGIPVDGTYLVLPGPATARKGAHLLLGAMQRGEMPSPMRLMLAGPVSSDIKPEVDRTLRMDGPADQLVILDRFLDQEQFWLAICAADVIAAPYLDHVGSSGIVARAAYARRPILASDYGWVGEATRRFGLGMTVDVHDPDEFASALRSVTFLATKHESGVQADEFVNFNTPAAFKDAWTRSIRESSDPS